MELGPRSGSCQCASASGGGLATAQVGRVSSVSDAHLKLTRMASCRTATDKTDFKAQQPLAQAASQSVARKNACSTAACSKKTIRVVPDIRSGVNPDICMDEIGLRWIAKLLCQRKEA